MYVHMCIVFTYIHMYTWHIRGVWFIAWLAPNPVTKLLCSVLYVLATPMLQSCRLNVVCPGEGLASNGELLLE